MLFSTDTLYKGLTIPTQYNTEEVVDWMNAVGSRSNPGLYGDDATDQIAEGVREGMYEVMVRENDLLREQNELLRQLLAKDTTVEVTANSFTKAMNRKNQRDGKTIVSING